MQCSKALIMHMPAQKKMQTAGTGEIQEEEEEKEEEEEVYK